MTAFTPAQEAVMEFLTKLNLPFPNDYVSSVYFSGSSDTIDVAHFVEYDGQRKLDAANVPVIEVHRVIRRKSPIEDLEGWNE